MLCHGYGEGFSKSFNVSFVNETTKDCHQIKDLKNMRIDLRFIKEQQNINYKYNRTTKLLKMIIFHVKP